MSIPTGIRKDKNPTGSALFGVASIQTVVGYLGWSMYRDQFGWFDWVIAFSAGIYVVLAIAAHWYRLAASVMGAAFYVAFLVFQGIRSVDLLMADLIFKVPVIILLIIAVVFALRRPPMPPPPAERERV
jgi:hypothetical protein